MFLCQSCFYSDLLNDVRTMMSLLDFAPSGPYSLPCSPPPLYCSFFCCCNSFFFLLRFKCFNKEIFFSSLLIISLSAAAPAAFFSSSYRRYHYNLFESASTLPLLLKVMFLMVSLFAAAAFDDASLLLLSLSTFFVFSFLVFWNYLLPSHGIVSPALPAALLLFCSLLSSNFLLFFLLFLVNFFILSYFLLTRSINFNEANQVSWYKNQLHCFRYRTRVSKMTRPSEYVKLDWKYRQTSLCDHLKKK